MDFTRSCRFCHAALLTFIGLSAGAPVGDWTMSNSPDCIELVREDVHWMKTRSYLWSKGMVFERHQVESPQQGMAKVYYALQKKTDRCFYPWQGKLRTTTLSRCQEGTLDGKGFHYVPSKFWKEGTCNQAVQANEL
mmetsp:Transcript_2364/g.4676  ORF Transcript_2364/g.4676 Transcript_2364/m.4676 type:complete len:136 (-) Transcript_2364:156-563(-)